MSPCDDSVSNQLQIEQRRLRKNARTLLRRKAPQRPEQAAQYGSIVVQHRIVAILKQGPLNQSPLLPHDGPAADRPPKNPIHSAMSVIGAAVAVFAKSSAKFRQHDNYGVVPLGAKGLGEHLQAPS